MTTTLSTTSNLQGTSAGLQNLAAALFGLLSTAGWTQTADTGQTANGSFTGPGVANTKAGYQIWKMNDSLAGSAPVYVRFDLGTNNQTTVGSSIWLTIGTGSDGAGNITGTILASTQLDGTGGSYANGTSVYIGSANTNYIAWTQCTSGLSSIAGLQFSIERTHDASGNDTNEGLLVFRCGKQAAAISGAWYYLRFTNNTLPSSTAIGAWAPSGTSWSDPGGSNNIGVCPVRFFNGAPSNPSICWQVYLNGDQAQDQVIPVSMYGTTRSYYALGATKVSTVASGNANSTLMMIYQ